MREGRGSRMSSHMTVFRNTNDVDRREKLLEELRLLIIDQEGKPTVRTLVLTFLSSF